MNPSADRSVLLLDPDNFTPYYVANLGHELAGRGWRVEWLTSPHLFAPVPAPEGVEQRNLFFRNLEATGGSTVKPARQRIWWLRRSAKALSYPFDLRRLDRELSSRPPGILHVQWALLPALDARFWSRWRRRGWKIVFTIHDLEPRAGSNPRLSGSSRRLFRVADAIVVHSQVDQAAVLESGIDGSRVRKILPGGGGIFELEAPPRDTARADLGLEAHRPTVLFFGLIKAYKGIGVLIDSLEHLRRQVPDAQLLIAGEIPGRERHWRQRLLRAEVDGGVIWHAGYVPQERVSLYFAAADVVALPYLASSTSGVVPLVYAAGRPLVASSTGALPEMIDDRRNGLLVPPRDPDALAAALAELLLDPDRARQMGAVSRQLASRFSWARTAVETEELYRSL